MLDRRVRTPAGEVDLVARRGSLVAFIEVKTRATAADLDWAIDERRLARVAAAAELLMPRYAGPGRRYPRRTCCCTPPVAGRVISRMPGSAAETRLHPAAQRPKPDRSAHVPFPSRSRWTRFAGINIAGDSSFALMLSAQARGHRLFHYGPEDLNWSDGRLTARAHPETAAGGAGDHFRFDAPVRLDLGAEVDVILMRQDPPFDLGYITATHLLERIADQTLVVKRSAQRPQRARKGVRAGLCAFHAADAHHPLAGGGARLPGDAWRDRGQAAARQWRQGDLRVGADGANLSR